jgi:RNA 3'-phosphate cyclase
MLEIDGSMGEGGGQVLRTALSLSCVLRRPVRISNIRAGRENPGLRPQHLAVCNLLGQISGAKMEGAAIGSREITFEPGGIAGGDYKFDIGTAGSCTLLLSAALPAMLFASNGCSLEITGGTHVRGAPTYEYFSEVFLIAARKFGVRCVAQMGAAGFYPKGGGKITVQTQPSKLTGSVFENPHGGKGAAFSIVSSGVPPHVAAREEESLRSIMHGQSLRGKSAAAHAACPGNALTLWHGPFGAQSIGERGKSAEEVAREACDFFLSESGSGASVDSHLADQLLLYAALSEGRTEYKVPKFTPHLLTNADVVRAMTGRNIILRADSTVEVD